MTFDSLYSTLRNQGCNYPFKGGKDTFWEGGVRGVGFVHSNLIRNKGRVSYDLIDVTDWLPTFYHLAGGDVNKIQDKIDGMNVWDTIAYGKKSPRTEVGPASKVYLTRNKFRMKSQIKFRTDSDFITSTILVDHVVWSPSCVRLIHVYKSPNPLSSQVQTMHRVNNDRVTLNYPS